MARAKTVWSSMPRILIREVATPWVSSFYFKAVIQAVLLFGAETWVVTPPHGKGPGGVQTQLERRITGQLPRRKTYGTWRYTSMAASREAVGFLIME